MASKLTEQDYQDAARLLQCELAAIKAVAAVESRGSGFHDNGKPRILFERHIFHRYTKGRWDGSHPGLSSATPGGYGAASVQWERFEMAAQLDRKAAMLSISMGLFQIMGFNFQAAGFPTVEAFFDAMHKDEREHLIAFCRFLKSVGLDDELRDHEWRAFARGYNGPAYRKNNYDTKLAAAYKRFAEDAGDILELDLPAPPPTAPQPITTPTTAPPPAPAPSLSEQIKSQAEEIGETATVVSAAAAKAADSVKAFRTFLAMAGFGTTVASMGAWFKENGVLNLLIFVGIAIVCAFAWKYLHRQQVIAVERTKKQ